MCYNTISFFDFRLVQYKQLLDQMESLDAIMTPQVNNILQLLDHKTTKKNDGEMIKYDGKSLKLLEKLIKHAHTGAARQTKVNAATADDRR